MMSALTMASLIVADNDWDSNATDGAQAHNV